MIKTSQSLSRMITLAKLFRGDTVSPMANAMYFSEIMKETIPGMEFKSPKKYPLPDFKGAIPKEVHEYWEESKKNMITLDDALNLISYERPTVRQSAYVALEKNGVVYHLFDASRIPFGRMCAQISVFLRGKNKPTYRIDKVTRGDVCVVVNASDMKFVGKGLKIREFIYHTGFIGHLRRIPMKDMILTKPEVVVHRCVSKMLPKNTLRKDILKNLYVYRDQQHDFEGILPYFNTLKPDISEGVERLKINPDTAVVVAEHHFGEQPEIFKNFKREYDPEISVPITQRKSYVKETRSLKKEMQRYDNWKKRMEARNEDIRVTKPKSHAPSITQDASFVVKSHKQIKRWGMTQHFPKEGEVIDDDDTDV